MTYGKALAIITLILLCSVAYGGPANSTMNVVVVLDGSGSMAERMPGGVKIDVAKKALCAVLEKVPTGSKVGILCFSNSTRGWIYNLQELNVTEAENSLNQVTPGGRTPLGEFMKTGANALIEQRKKERYGIYRLLIVTDGEATDDAETPLSGPGGILTKGLTISAIGVNIREGHSLATKIPYRNATDPEGLQTAIAAVFAETTGDDINGVSDFDLLSGLDDQVASAVLKSLGTYDNTEVGHVPVVDEQGAPVMVQGQQKSVPAVSPPKSSSGIGMILGLVALVVLAGLFFAWLFFGD